MALNVGNDGAQSNVCVDVYTQCKDMYESELAAARARTDMRQVGSCMDEAYPVVVLLAVFMPLTILLVWYICRH